MANSSLLFSGCSFMLVARVCESKRRVMNGDITLMREGNSPPKTKKEAKK